MPFKASTNHSILPEKKSALIFCRAFQTAVLTSLCLFADGVLHSALWSWPQHLPHMSPEKRAPLCLLSLIPTFLLDGWWCGWDSITVSSGFIRLPWVVWWGWEEKGCSLRQETFGSGKGCRLWGQEMWVPRGKERRGIMLYTAVVTPKWGVNTTSRL